MKPISPVAEDAARSSLMASIESRAKDLRKYLKTADRESIMASIESRAKDLRKYLKTADRESIESDMRDAWLLWRSFVRVYAIAVRIILLGRGTGIVSDMKQYPWLLAVMDVRGFFRAVRGRKGAYRKAILKVFETMTSGMVSYVIDVLKHPERVVYIQSDAGGLAELLKAMGLIPMVDMLAPIVSVLANPHSMEKYIDFAENAGVPSDACSAGRSAQGILLKNEAPKAAVIVGSNMCEGQVNSTLLYTKFTGLPTYILDVPYNFRAERTENWIDKEVLKLVEWLEDNTPGRMDWDRLRELLEERNRAISAEMELWEMMRLRPAPFAGEVIFFAHVVCVIIMAGSKEATEVFEHLVTCARENMEKGTGVLPDERFRAVIWNPIPPVHWHILRYLELKWGIAILQDSTVYNDLGLADTSSRESMLRHIGRLMLNTPITNLTRTDAESYLKNFTHIVKHWDANLVLLGDHLGCKTAVAMKEMLRERCRELEIPIVCVPVDVMDPRSASWKDVTNAFDQFMETVMKAEPLREEVPVP